MLSRIAIIRQRNKISGGQLFNTMMQEEDNLRSCFFCGLKGISDMFIPCVNCKAVLYCDDNCQEKALKLRHRTWCRKFVKFMQLGPELGKFPFTFCQETTNLDFNKEKLACFLKHYDVYGKGLWRRECPPSEDMCRIVPFGELQHLDKPYVLPLEDAVLMGPPPDSGPPQLENPLQDWADYYNYRGFWLDSPIAGLLHYPLTLYWIVTHCLPIHYPVVFQKIKVSKNLQVHILGAEKEAEMFNPFLECARLLVPVHLHVHLFGDEVSKCVHNKSFEKENLTFHLHCGLYHEYNLHQLAKPDLVVSFNAGLSAYHTFKDTIQLLLENKMPLYCTDYCYYSIVHSMKALSSNRIGTVLGPVINPFRSPFHLVAPDMNLPRYSNAFVYHLQSYTEKNREMIHQDQEAHPEAHPW